MSLPRLAMLADFREEHWASMDLCAEMLFRHLRAEHADWFDIEHICPPFRRRLGRLPLVGARQLGQNADRLANRFWDYPREVRRLRPRFDLFHLCDHSYAQLVHGLPAERTGVFCHDLDTFRCVLYPEQERRPRWFRAMTRRILDGLRKAAVVFHTTEAVRREVLAHGLVDPARLVQAPYGVSPEFQPEPVDPDPAAALLAPLNGAPFILHVGTCIPRKRIDLLLEIFAGMRRQVPELRLVKAGSEWTPEQREQLERLGLQDAILHLYHRNRPDLAALYRTTRLVLLPSEKEGFGIPVIEALACGAAVLASDIPSVREAGGEAIHYAPVGDVPRWVERAVSLVRAPARGPALGARLAQARQFSWQNHATIIGKAYQALRER